MHSVNVSTEFLPRCIRDMSTTLCHVGCHASVRCGTGSWEGERRTPPGSCEVAVDQDALVSRLTLAHDGSNRERLRMILIRKLRLIL